MAIDPDWSNVVLRLTFDSNLTDYSDSAHATVYSGTFDYVAGQFGNAIRNGGAGGSGGLANSVSVTDDGDFSFGSGDFTVEFWVDRSSGGGFTSAAVGTSNGSGFRAWSVGITQSGNLAVRLSANGTAYVINQTSIVSLAAGTLHHIVLERAGTALRVYANGTMYYKGTLTGALHAGSGTLRINGAELFNNQGAAGRIDDLRITKGVARYNSDSGLTVPTEAYPLTGAGADVTITPTPGELEITGEAPTVIGAEIVEPSPGALVIQGFAPAFASNITIDVPSGELEITGSAPAAYLGLVVTPSPGALVIAPGAPEVLIYTQAATLQSQFAVLSPTTAPSAARASGEAILAAGFRIPPMAASQQALMVMADAHPCASRLCQVWRFRRQDGEEFAFTSHDEPVSFMGTTFTPCASLNPTAVEAASDMASIGNMELSGIIDSEHISEFDLYAGKFDDCHVEVWEIPWSGSFPHPIRLAAGTTGSVSHGRDGFRAEVLGPGAKMQQQAITTVVTAACRFTFGDARCGKDLGPLTETGAVGQVSTFAPYRTFTAPALVGSGPEGYFARGVVTWTSGENAGLKSEVKEYDPATGTVVLWNLLPARLGVGDAFTITPGCTLSADGDMGCRWWANYINFGGFPDVPGDDATSEIPVAKV